MRKHRAQTDVQTPECWAIELPPFKWASTRYTPHHPRHHLSLSSTRKSKNDEETAPQVAKQFHSVLLHTVPQCLAQIWKRNANEAVLPAAPPLGIPSTVTQSRWSNLSLSLHDALTLAALAIVSKLHHNPWLCRIIFSWMVVTS